jgi:predicted O-methyltransferase YrrM
MKAIHQGTQWLRHQWKAGTKHDVHSPFIFDLYTNSITSTAIPPIAQAIESRRNELKGDTSIIHVKDFGSAMRGATYPRTISSIAQVSSKSPKVAHLLWRLSNTLHSNVILDLGTSFGFTTSYLATANANSIVHSFEGCEQTLNVAAKTFEKLNISNVQTHLGDVQETLSLVLSKLQYVDLVFFDANHQYQPTLDYFNLCLEKKHNDSLFIFDDIHWSEGMSKAWDEICQHPSVTVSIDLYQIGLVFFRREQVKQHFRLRF